MSGRRASVLLLAALALAPRGASADETTDFEKGRYAYIARKYDEADERFRAMLDPATGTVKDRALVAQARMHWGAVLWAKGKRAEAEEIFERLLLDDPLFEPDPLGFPTEVINAFVDVRARIRELLRAAAQEKARREADRKVREESERRRESARIATLERLAREETLVERHSRLLALVPFGAGQFQNQQRSLGYFFLSTELAFLATTAVTLPVYLTQVSSASEAYQARDSFRAQQYLDRAATTRIVNLVAVGAFAATAIAGVVHAQMTFVPEHSATRSRAMPKELAPFVAPTAGPSREGAAMDGAMFGVVGRF